MAERDIIGKLALKDLGNPELVKSLPPEKLSNGKYILGLLIGKADGFIKRSDPKTNEEFEGLSGSFVMKPFDPEVPEKESGVLFIPDAFHNLVAQKLREFPEGQAANVEFAFEVASIKASNPRGYSWSFTPAIPFEGKHPLDGMFEKLASAKTRKLAAPPPIKK